MIGGVMSSMEWTDSEWQTSHVEDLAVVSVLLTYLALMNPSNMRDKLQNGAE